MPLYLVVQDAVDIRGRSSTKFGLREPAEGCDVATENIGFLERHGWLSNPGNRVVLDFDGQNFS